jgi:RNA polymerase sigma factor for flagellar operon FliA
MRAYAKSAAQDPARQQRILDHTQMARRIALRVGRRVPDWITADDLIAAAMIGLAEAADRYDASRGEPFVAFAEKRIRGAVLDELRRGDILPRRARQAARKVGEAVRSLTGRLGRPPEDEEIAAELGVPVDAYREELEGLVHVGCVELGPEVTERRHSDLPEKSSPAAHAEKAQIMSHLRTALDVLPERDLRILSLYYVEELPYAEIGRLIGVSESRVCQLHSRALARLRAEMPDHDGADDGDDDETPRAPTPRRAPAAAAGRSL